MKGRVQIDNGIVTLNACTGAILGLAIKKYDTQTGGRLRPLAGLISKLRKDNIEVPGELLAQYESLQR